jgi:serine protease
VFFALAACAIALAPAARATDEVIVVKFRSGVLPADATSLPPELARSIADALGAQFSVVGQARDGAFRLSLSAALDPVATREAVNRLRDFPLTVYASLRNPQAEARAVLEDTSPRPPVNQIVVKYRDPSLTQRALQNLPLDSAKVDRLAQMAGQPLFAARAMTGGAYVLRLFQPLPDAQAESLARFIETDPAIEFAAPDRLKFHQLTPNDTCYASGTFPTCGGIQQWDLYEAAGGINVPNAWNLTTGSTSIRIGVVDTGILAHPDLAGRTVEGYDMVADCAVANDASAPCTWAPLPYDAANPPAPSQNSRDSDPSDPGDWVTSSESAGMGALGPPYDWFFGCPSHNSSWHGTHVTGTIGAVANNGSGIAGINWTSPIVPVRVLGKCGGYTSDVMDGVAWAAGLAVPGVPANANPVRVVNLSLGGGGPCDPDLEQPVIDSVLAAGVVVVIAAGNNNQDAATFSPGNCNGVITVAATQRAGARAGYSNFGYPTIEIAAPGGGDGNLILSTLNTGPTVPGSYVFAGYNGTSMAAPHVTGVVSLMLSVNGAQTPAQILSKIQATARAFPTSTVRDCTSNPGAVNVTVKYCGAGIVDAAAAVNASVARDSIGLFDPASRTFYLRVNNEGGDANYAFTFGAAGDVPIVGDWNGDGVDTVGVYRPSTGDFFLRNSNAPGAPDVSFVFGAGGAVPLAGDWNGDGVDTVGIYVPATGTFFLKNTNAAGPADIVFTFGPGGAGVVPLVGDWNGDGTDTVGLYVAATGTFFLKNSNAAGPADVAFTFGPGGAGWTPIVGDWNNTGSKKIGVYNSATGTFFLRNSNSSGPANTAFAFGPAGLVPLAGDWDNLP